MTIVDALEKIIAQIPYDADRESCLSLHTDWVAFEDTETQDDSLCTVLEGMLLQSVLLNTIIRCTVNDSHKIQCQLFLDSLREVFAEIEKSSSTPAALSVIDQDPSVDKDILSPSDGGITPTPMPPVVVFNALASTVQQPQARAETLPLQNPTQTIPTVIAVATPAIPDNNPIIQRLGSQVEQLEETLAHLMESIHSLSPKTEESYVPSFADSTEEPWKGKNSPPFLPSESPGLPPTHLVGFGTYVINQNCTFQNCTFNVFGAPPSASPRPPL